MITCLVATAHFIGSAGRHVVHATLICVRWAGASCGHDPTRIIAWLQLLNWVYQELQVPPPPPPPPTLLIKAAVAILSASIRNVAD